MTTGRRFATCEVVHGSAACRRPLVLVLIFLTSLSCLSSAIHLPPPRENVARNRKATVIDKFPELTANGADETNKFPELATNQNAPISGNTKDSDSFHRATVSTETASHDVEAPSHHDPSSIATPTATVELNSEQASLDSNVSPPPSRASTAADLNRDKESFNRNASPTPTTSSFMPTPTATADLNRDEASLNHDDVSSPPSLVSTAMDLNGEQESLNGNASPTPATSSKSSKNPKPKTSKSFSLDKTKVPSKRASRSSSRRRRLSPRRRPSEGSRSPLDILAKEDTLLSLAAISGKRGKKRVSYATVQLSSRARRQAMKRSSHFSAAARRLPVTKQSQREPEEASAFAFSDSRAGTSSSASPSSSNALNKGNRAVGKSFLLQTRSADNPVTATTSKSGITFEIEAPPTDTPRTTALPTDTPKSTAPPTDTPRSTAPPTATPKDADQLSSLSHGQKRGFDDVNRNELPI